MLRIKRTVAETQAFYFGELSLKKPKAHIDGHDGALVETIWLDLWAEWWTADADEPEV